MSAPNHHMSCLREVPLLGPLAAVVLFCALRPIWDGDEWWHVTVGRFILDSGRLPTVDVWSAADPAPEWRSIQWGWQVVAAWIDRLGGLEALRRANAAWICATFIAFYLLVRRGGERRAIALLLGAALLESFHDRFRVRPMVVSATLWLALAFLVADLRAARVRHAVALGALFASWSMIHGGEACLAMIGLLFTCAAGVALRGRRTVASDRAILVATLVALVGWMGAPAALPTLLFTVQGVGSHSEEFNSWIHIAASLPARQSWERLHVVGTLGVAPVALWFWGRALRRWGRAYARDDRSLAVGRPYELALAGWYIALAFWGVRFVYLAVPAIVLCRRFLAALPEGLPKPPGRVGRSMPFVVAGLVVTVELLYATVGQFPSLDAAIRARASTYDAARFPMLVTRLLVDSGIEARVATPAAWGGYVIYHGAPRLRVTLDSRYSAPPEVLATTEIVADIFNRSGRAELLPRLYSTLPADFLIMPHPAFLGREDTGEWLRIAETDLADLYARRSPRLDAEWLPRLREAHRRNLAPPP